MTPSEIEITLAQLESMTGSPEVTKHLVTALEEFGALGIDFVSLSESVDTSTPIGKMIFTVLSAVAELERNLIRERIAMGLDRARKQKKTAGHVGFSIAVRL